jgi:hypothetical protein
MNDREQLDRQQLEAATSRSLHATRALDSETSALRDGFITLGRSVEAAAADYDEAALIARVQAACLNDDAPVMPARRGAPVWALLLSGVLAASALIAVVRIVAIWTDSAAVVAQPTLPTRNTEDPQPDALVNDGTSSAADAAIAWDDPLDDEIAAAQSSLADLSGPLIGIDSELSNIHQSLDALSHDLSGESL